jgi:hypothetical protein
MDTKDRARIFSMTGFTGCSSPPRGPLRTAADELLDRELAHVTQAYYANGGGTGQNYARLLKEEARIEQLRAAARQVRVEEIERVAAEERAASRQRARDVRAAHLQRIRDARVASLQSAHDAELLTKIHQALWELHPDKIARTLIVLRLATEARQAGLTLESVLHQLTSW